MKQKNWEEKYTTGIYLNLPLPLKKMLCKIIWDKIDQEKIFRNRRRKKRILESQYFWKNGSIHQENIIFVNIHHLKTQHQNIWNKNLKNHTEKLRNLPSYWDIYITLSGTDRYSRQNSVDRKCEQYRNKFSLMYISMQQLKKTHLFQAHMGDLQNRETPYTSR